MRTKEPKKSNYEEIARRSVQKDFRMSQKRPSNVHRVLGLSESSTYYKYRRFIVGKLVRFVGFGFSGGSYYQFEHDEDRKMLNREAGWSDNKTQYLFDGITLD